MANRLGRPVHRRTSHAPFPGAAAAAPRRSALPLRHVDRHARPAPRVRARRAPHFGLTRDAPVLLVFGGSQGAAAAQRGGRRARCRACGQPGIAGAARLRPSQRRRPASAGEPGVRRRCAYIDRMDLAYAAADLALCRGRGHDLRRARRRRAAGRLRAAAHRQRRAAAQRAAGRGGRRRGARRRRGAHGRTWLARRRRRCCTTPARLRAMGAAAAGDGVRDADARLARLVVECGGRSARRGRREEPRARASTEHSGRVHIVGHRRRRDVRHRAHPASRAASPVSRQRRQGLAGASRRCAPSASMPTSATTPRTSPAPTPSSSRPPSAETTPSWSRRGRAGSG